MRFFSTLAAVGLAAMVSAQSASETSNSTMVSHTSSTAPAATSLTAEQKCLNACGRADICCQAACVNVPCPSQLQANQTTECAAQCPQGNGTKEETNSYAACQSSCISSLFFATATGSNGAAATASGSGASSSAEATGIGASSSGSAATGASASGSGTASSTGAGSSSTSNVASSIKNQVAGAGLVGLILAGLAL